MDLPQFYQLDETASEAFLGAIISKWNQKTELWRKTGANLALPSKCTTQRACYTASTRYHPYSEINSRHGILSFSYSSLFLSSNRGPYGLHTDL
ncbi:hypothetical protein CEXT_323881 [Caerostris extrusa]|uniref:Uncharacterized protein n=1 Tax=Caerostris extrusa TaxID=172846 RepID=A0AAV4SWE8_CAEEX|nr:hypothetical protein CEXT_323881 [Caerostris extrusa]